MHFSLLSIYDSSRQQNLYLGLWKVTCNLGYVFILKKIAYSDYNISLAMSLPFESHRGNPLVDSCISSSYDKVVVWIEIFVGKSENPNLKAGNRFLLFEIVLVELHY